MQEKYVDYYQVLGVGRTATEKEIKAAYRKLARKYHPDVNPGDKDAETRFKEISQAHEILTDTKKRAAFDQLGQYWKDASRGGFASPGTGANPFGGFRPGGSGFPGGAKPANLEELFKTLFGDAGFASADKGFGTPFRSGAEPRDQEIEIELDLPEAFRGTRRTFQLKAPGHRFHLDKDGASGETQDVDVRIPAGIADGQKVRIAGRGIDGGDLYVRIKLRPHLRFERRGDDLATEVPVSFTKAALGGEVTVPTLAGPDVTIRVPPGTQSGQSMRIAGQGMPRLKGSGAGDLLAKIRITVPKQLGDRERQLLVELASLIGDR